MDLQCSGLLYSPLNCCRCKTLDTSVPQFPLIVTKSSAEPWAAAPHNPSGRTAFKRTPKTDSFPYISTLWSVLLICFLLSCFTASPMKGCCFSLSLLLHHCPLLNKNSYRRWEKDKAKKISSPWSRLLRVGYTVGYLFVIRGIYLCLKQPSTLFVESKYKHEALNYI